MSYFSEISLINLYKPKVPVPASAGIDIKNEIFAASSLLNLNILAPVITIPDLLTPGIKARTCKKPIIKTLLLLKFFFMLLLVLHLSAK